jgi:hypothetical protein
MTRGRPFEPGNKFGRGRPKGSRNKRTAEAQALFDEYKDPHHQEMHLQGARRRLPSHQLVRGAYFIALARFTGADEIAKSGEPGRHRGGDSAVGRGPGKR